MNKYITHSNLLKKDADLLLKKYSIFQTLSKYGKVQFTGSYDYDVLTWGDIDICVTVARPTVDLLFKIGQELSKIPFITTMYFRNELVLKTKDNPHGMFWCIELIYNSQIWKIDLLVSDAKSTKKVILKSAYVKNSLTPKNRESIIILKSILGKNKEYRREYRSTDIYDAVIKHNVSTMDEWNNYWGSRK